MSLSVEEQNKLYSGVISFTKKISSFKKQTDDVVDINIENVKFRAVTDQN